MPRRASILGGPYGDGTYGLKCSRPGYDVLDLAGDNDIVKRSYNSQWTDIAKIKIRGVGLADWRAYQEHGFQGTKVWEWARSGWRRDQSWIVVPTGLTYIPVWEARLFNPVMGVFLDDHCNLSFYADYGYTSTSGGRARLAGPGSSMAPNNIAFSPWEDYTTVKRPNATGYDGVTHNVSSYIENTPIGTYPPFPAKPADDLGMAYVVYRNKMGDIA